MMNYTLTETEHGAWYGGDQREHDSLHDDLRARLQPGTEVYDVDGIVICTI